MKTTKASTWVFDIKGKFIEPQPLNNICHFYMQR